MIHERITMHPAGSGRVPAVELSLPVVELWRERVGLGVRRSNVRAGSHLKEVSHVDRHQVRRCQRSGPQGL